MGTAQFRSLRIFRMLLLSYAIANAGWATGPRRHASRESQISPGRDKNDRADHVLLLTQSGFPSRVVLKVVPSHGYRRFLPLSRCGRLTHPKLFRRRSQVGPRPCCHGRGDSCRRVAKPLKKAPSAGTAGTRTGHRPALRSPSSAMTVKDDTTAFLNALQESREAAERGENDESSRPGPSKTDIARGRWPRLLQVIAALLDNQKTGVLPDSDAPTDAFSSRSVRHLDEQSKSLLSQRYRGGFGIS
jgi:hypothetical protein